MSCDFLFNPLNGYQNVFCGASIRADQPISWRLGYNEDVSSMTIHLAVDSCPTTGTKICHDLQTKAALGATLDLSPFEFQTGDPGFTQPQPGEPVYFRIGDNFDFGGIVNSWTENNSVNEKPTYSLTINDPREILERCHVILDGYVGGTYSTPNVFNVYAMQEAYGSYCGEALLSDFTGPGTFGGSQVNDFGMFWNRVRSGLMLLTSSMPAITNNWADGGRIRFCGYDYILDISELPRINNYRINADSMTIADIIKEITTFLSWDYYVTLEHVMYGGEVLRAIKVHCIDRRGIPVLDSIDDFIGNSEGVVDSTKGRELRNEQTAAILVGGPRLDMFVQTDNIGSVLQPTAYTDTACIPLGNGTFVEESNIKIGNNWANMTITPFWGFKPDGGVIIGEGLNLDHNFTVDLSYAGIGSKDGTKRLTYYNISVEEIHCALAGKDTWLSYISAAKPEIASILGLDDHPVDFLGVLGRSILNIQNDLTKPGVTPHDLVRIKKASIECYNDWYNGLSNRQYVQFNIDTLFRVVEHYGTNFYGRRFMVRMYDQSTGNSFVCAKRDVTTNQVTFSKETIDAGWSDYTDGFMGMQSQVFLDRFRTEDDRIESFVRFNGAQDLVIPDLDNTEFVYQNLGRINTKFDANIFNDQYEDEINFQFAETLFIRCSVEKDFVFPTTACGNPVYSDPRAVITLPTFIKQKRNEVTDSVPYFLQFLYKGLGAVRDLQQAPWNQIPDEQIVSEIRNLMSSAGISALHNGEDTLRLMPNAVAIPLKSNISTYGPWFASADGIQGGANYSQDDSMVPWNYGDSASMNVAGTLLVTESLSIMQQSERGSITMPGLPLVRLGDEINSGGTTISALREFLVRPHIMDDIEFTAAELTSDRWRGLYGPNVTEISIDISQNGIQTHYDMRTYSPSLTRNKYYAERIKNRGLLAQQNRRRRRGTFERKEDLRDTIRNITNDLLRQRQEQTGIFAKSPHMMLLGQNFNYQVDPDFYGPGECETLTRSVVQTQNILEVQTELSNWIDKHAMSWDGLLIPVSTKQFVIPDRDSDESTDQVRITSETLNPFLGPNDREPSSPFANNYVGHNIEFITRDSGVPEDLSIRVNDEYGTDHYRFFAHRAPMILAGWGYNEDGKPVPNEAEEEDFEGEDFTNKFAKNWLRRPDIWKVGGLDIRWSEKKGLWTFPAGSVRIKRAIMCTDMPHTLLATGLAILPSEPVVVNEEDEDESDPLCPGNKVTIYNTSGKPVRRGANIVCYFDNDENGYITLEVPDPIYGVYIPNNINPVGGVLASGAGYLDIGPLCARMNDHIEAPSGTVNVFTLNQPIRKGSSAICYERKLNEFYLIKSQHHPLCVVTDVACEEIYTSEGTSRQLVVSDTTVWLEANWLDEDAENSCTVSVPDPADFVGAEE